MSMDPPALTFGPPRLFVPVWSCGPHGFTFHGPMGYEEMSEEEAARRIGLGRIVVEANDLTSSTSRPVGEAPTTAPNGTQPG